VCTFLDCVYVRTSTTKVYSIQILKPVISSIHYNVMEYKNVEQVEHGDYTATKLEQEYNLSGSPSAFGEILGR